MARPRTSLFLAYCPDRAGALEARLKVRAEHYRLFNVDKAEGRAEFGRAFLPPPDSPLHANPPASLPKDVQPMGGSVMLLRMPDLEATWKRLKEDPYWTAGVWDRDRIIVERFCEAPDAASVAAKEQHDKERRVQMGAGLDGVLGADEDK